MWKREEVRVPPQPANPPVPAPVPAPVQVRAPEPSIARTESIRQEKAVVNIGKSVIIKGELSGSEDLTIEGQVEGKIELRQNVLTIGPNAKIKAQVAAKTIVVEGSVQGNVVASERIEIRDKGSVEGDLAAPRVAIADGAHFRGSIDMQQGRAAADRQADHKPAAAAAASSPAAPAASPVSPQPSTPSTASAPAGVGAR
jgi:cytoskeletal protein CcmA (bactofilin family)